MGPVYQRLAPFQYRVPGSVRQRAPCAGSLLPILFRETRPVHQRLVAFPPLSLFGSRWNGCALRIAALRRLPIGGRTRRRGPVLLVREGARPTVQEISLIPRQRMMTQPNARTVRHLSLIRDSDRPHNSHSRILFDSPQRRHLTAFLLSHNLLNLHNGPAMPLLERSVLW